MTRLTLAFKLGWIVAGLLAVPIVTPAQTAADAAVLSQQGRFPEAARAWKAVTERNPSDAGAFASLGVVLSKQQKYAEAAGAYRKALSLQPKLPGVPLNLGLAEFKQGHFVAALAPLRSAVSADPGNTQARTLLGLSYYGAKKFAEAARELQAVAKADPGNVELNQVLAQSCLWAKQYDCAQEAFRQILEKDPDSASAHVLLGEALDGLGKTPEAIAEFQAAAKAAPSEPNVHFGLGYLYWKSHQYDDAKRAFEAELVIDPDHAQSLAYLGDIAMRSDDLERASKYLRQALDRQKDVRIAAIDLGLILAQLKKYPEAEAMLTRAIALQPEEPDAHYRLARLYREMGKSAESQKEFAKVRELREKADKVDENLVRKMSSAPPALNSPDASK